MKKLILQMNISVDGFVKDPEGHMDWMVPESDPRQIEFLNILVDRMSTIVLGRKMALESIPYWEDIARKQSNNPETEFARIFVKTPKIVFSKSISAIDGENTFVENGDLSEEINKLKTRSEKDMIVYGGANFVSSLIKERLFDELNLFTHPVALGNGFTIFDSKTKLKLIKSVSYDTGVILHQYAM